MRNLFSALLACVLGGCAVFSPILPTRVVANDNLMQVLTTLGLTTNLKLVLDAGDVDSYPGNGQKWLDRAGGGYDFFIGADGTASSTDPTFNGNVGNQATEYFSTDGGDYFTYDSANETWIKALGKPGSVSVLAVVRVVSDTTTCIFSTSTTGTGAGFGWQFSYDAGENKFVVKYVNTLGNISSITGGVSPDVSGSLPGLFLVGISITRDGAGNYSYVVHVNGTNYAATGTATIPTSSDPANVAKLLNSGDATEPAPSGTRLYGLAVWQGVELTAANWTAIWNAVHARYGL